MPRLGTIMKIWSNKCSIKLFPQLSRKQLLPHDPFQNSDLLAHFATNFLDVTFELQFIIERNT